MTDANIVTFTPTPTEEEKTYSLTNLAKPTTPTPASFHNLISSRIWCTRLAGVLIWSTRFKTLAFLCFHSCHAVAMMKELRPRLSNPCKVTRVLPHHSMKESSWLGMCKLTCKYSEASVPYLPRKDTLCQDVIHVILLIATRVAC